MSVRKELESLFLEDWAEDHDLSGVHVIATERGVDDIQHPTLIIRTVSVGRHPAAPQGTRNVGILLTLVSGHTDLDAAADELDELLEALLTYLDPRFVYEPATAVAYGDRLAFDLSLSIPAIKE